MTPGSFLLAAVFFISALSQNTYAQLQLKELRVSTYNVQGLPWPIRKNKKALMHAIGDYLKVARKEGTAPHVLVLQEAFIKDSFEIIKRAGYPYFVKGPSSRTINSDDHKKCLANGEAICSPGAKYLNSGLYIASEFPITRSAMDVFGRGRCTSWDCYSNKGVMFAEIIVPGISEPVQILNTHMQAVDGNLKKVRVAQLKQLNILQTFIKRHVNFSHPVIFPGDFNIRSTQSETFEAMMKMLPLDNVGLYCDQPQSFTRCNINASTDPLSLHASPDHHFWRSSPKINVIPVEAEKNMDHYLGKRPFSDHLAFEVKYLFY